MWLKAQFEFFTFLEKVSSTLESLILHDRSPSVVLVLITWHQRRVCYQSAGQMYLKDFWVAWLTPRWAERHRPPVHVADSHHQSAVQTAEVSVWFISRHLGELHATTAPMILHVSHNQSVNTCKHLCSEPPPFLHHAGPSNAPRRESELNITSLSLSGGGADSVIDYWTSVYDFKHFLNWTHVVIVRFLQMLFSPGEAAESHSADKEEQDEQESLLSRKSKKWSVFFSSDGFQLVCCKMAAALKTLVFESGETALVQDIWVWILKHFL